MGKDLIRRNTEAKENLKKYLNSLNQIVESDEGLGSMYADFIGYLDSINDMTNKLYERDGDGNLRPFTAEDQEKLLDGYSEALYELFRLQIEITPEQAELYELVNSIKNMLDTDVSTLTNIAADNEKSIVQALEDGRTIRVDITGKEFSTVGAASSSRMAMDIVMGGKEMKGFFTKEKKFETKFSGPAVDEVVDDWKKRMPESAELFDFIRDQYANGILDSGEITGAFTDKYPELDFSNILLTVSTFAEDPLIADIRNEIEIMQRQYGTDGIDVNIGDSVSGRNVAMSRMANLFGVSDIVAESEMMELSDDKGNIIKGVFMANAKGIDHDKIMPEKVENFTEKGGDNPSLLKNIAELQMLDYICGNVDRHQNNFFYQFNEDGTQLVGIQGIDNDFSFGKKGIGGAAEIDIENINVISQSMGEKLMLLDDSMVELSLCGTGVGEAEIDAAINRINDVKKRIASKKIELVPDEKWKDYTLEGLAAGKKTNSLFGLVNTQVTRMKTIAAENQAAAEKKAKEASSNPEKKPFKFEKVVEIDGINKASMDIDAKKTNDFSQRMARSQKKIVGKGSEAFRDVQTAIGEYNALVAGLGETPSAKDYLKIQLKQEEIIGLSDMYIASKKNQKLNKNGKERFVMMNDINSYFKMRAPEFKLALQQQQERQFAEETERVKAQAQAVYDAKANADLEFINSLDAKYDEFVKNPRPNSLDIKVTGFVQKSMSDVLAESDNYACSQALSYIKTRDVVNVAAKLNKAATREEFDAILNDKHNGINTNELSVIKANADFIYKCVEKDRRELPQRQKNAALLLDNIKYPSVDRSKCEDIAKQNGIKTKDSSGDQHYLENVEKLRAIKKKNVLDLYGKKGSDVPRWAQCLYSKPGLTEEERQIINESGSSPEAKAKLYDFALKELASIDVNEMLRDKTMDEYVNSYEQEAYLRQLSWDHVTMYIDMDKSIEAGEYLVDKSVYERTKNFAEAIHGNASNINTKIEQYERPQSMVFDIAGNTDEIGKLIAANGISEEERNFGILQVTADNAMDPIPNIKRQKEILDITNELEKHAKEHLGKARESLEKLKAGNLDPKESKRVLKGLVDESSKVMYFNSSKLNADKLNMKGLEEILDPANMQKKLPDIQATMAEKMSKLTMEELESVVYSNEVDMKRAYDFRDSLGQRLQEKALEKQSAQKQNSAPDKQNNVKEL